MKQCSTCREAKCKEEFGKDSSRKDGLRTYCKCCAKEHRQKSAATSAQWRQANRDSSRQYSANYYKSNKKSLLEKQKIYREESHEAIKLSKAMYYSRKKHEISEKHKHYALLNHESIREYKREWTARRKVTHPEFALSIRYRKRVRMAVAKQGIKIGGRTHALVGCGWAQLKDHLESMFVEGMSWDNFSDWHIDHVIPLSSAKDEKSLVALCHYSNLQPMWPIDNLKKGASMPCHAKSA